MKYLLGIDNGGTFSKAAIFDENGEQISVASVPTETLTPKPGYTEKNLDDLWDVNAQAIKNAIEKSGIDSKEIAGISFSGAGKGLYMVGYDGKPSYNGIMSTDTRAWEQVEKWYADGITGNSGKNKIYFCGKRLYPFLPHRRSIQRIYRLLWRKSGQHGYETARPGTDGTVWIGRLL